eukprot:TRINITY_DN603_c0_g1_i1.p2 TRINITY_DN603_c0_g1~~TRINITY_DN603_c0_g1_i1.p2  ORF type:complete len:51 (-),score=17.88 TRINITY_DN603_c0_g1_i1:207-359(-)
MESSSKNDGDDSEDGDRNWKKGNKGGKNVGQLHNNDSVPNAGGITGKPLK